MLIVISIILIFIGLIFIYKTTLLVKICEFIKRYLVNERYMLLHGRKIGLFLILLGVLIIAIQIRRMINYNPLYIIHKKYYSREFTTVEKLCLEMLNKQPTNVELWMLLGKTYFVTGKYSQARMCFKKVLEMDNSKHQEVQKYLSLIETKVGVK